MRRICLAGLLALSLLLGGTSPPVSGAYPKGVDVSHWNIPAGRVLIGQDFMFARATYGTWKDDRFDSWMSLCRAKKMRLCGGYTFGINADGKAQAAALIAVAGKADALVLDWESDGGRPEMTSLQARAFVQTVHSAGRQLGLYHSESGFPDVGQDWDWVANWDHVPGIDWDFWQWQGSPLDRDYFAGSLADLTVFVKTQVFSVHVDAVSIGRQSNDRIRAYLVGLSAQMETLEGYIRNLARVDDPSPLQVAQEATYRGRLAALNADRKFLAGVIRVRGYIANLSAVKHPTAAQKAELKKYQARLRAWLEL